MTETPDPTPSTGGAPPEDPPATSAGEVPRGELAPVRTGLFCGLCGALGASAGWLLWIMVPQAAADPRGTFRSLAAGWLVGIAVEFVRWYRRLSHGGGGDAPRPVISLVVLPLVVLVVQTGAQEAVAQLLDAVIVPLVVSLSSYFLVGAVLGLLVLSWLSSHDSGEPIDLSTRVMYVLFWPVLALAIVFSFAIIVVYGLGYPIGLLITAVIPGAPVAGYGAWLLLVCVLAISPVMVARRGWHVVPAWAACCGLVFCLVAVPFAQPVYSGGEEDQRNSWSLLVVLSENALRASDVPAATWLRADRELSGASPTARSRTTAAEDTINRALRRQLGCGRPVPTGPPVGTKNPTKWREAQQHLAARRERVCATLVSSAGPGLTRSMYVVALFALGVAAGPWIERRAPAQGPPNIGPTLGRSRTAARPGPPGGRGTRHAVTIMSCPPGKHARDEGCATRRRQSGTP